MNKLFVNSNELMIEQVQEGVTPQLFTRTTKETGSTEQEASTKASKHIPAKSELRELVINKIESDNDVTYEAHYLVDPDSIAETKLVESDSITNARQDALSYIPVNHVSTEYVDLSVPEEVLSLSPCLLHKHLSWKSYPPNNSLSALARQEGECE